MSRLKYLLFPQLSVWNTFSQNQKKIDVTSKIIAKSQERWYFYLVLEEI